MSVAGVTFEIQGKKRLFRFQYLAMKGVCADFEIDKLEGLVKILGDGVSFDFLESAMYHGFKAGAKFNGDEVDFTPADMEAWMDADMNVVPKITKEVAGQLTEALQGPDEGKKKAVPLKAKKG